MDGSTVWFVMEKLCDRDILSASVLEVKDGDKVYWAYGTKDQIADYFGML